MVETDEARREHRRAYNRAWRAANRDKMRESERRQRAKHPEQFAEKRRRHRAKHPEKRLAEKRLYRQRHADKVRAVVNAWCRAHPEERRAISQNRRARKRAAAGHATAEQVRARFSMFGNRCAYCGGAAESIDHVIPLARGGSNWPANLRPCCSMCNSAKRDRPLAEFLAGRTHAS